MKLSKRLLVILLIGEGVGIFVMFGFILYWFFGRQQVTVAPVNEEAIVATSPSPTVLHEVALPSPLPLTPTPSPTLSIPLSPSVTAALQVTSNYITHVVRGGETLFTIAGIYGVSVDEILEINSHISDPNQIYPGDEILIPEGYTPLDGSAQQDSDVAKPYTTLPSFITADLSKLANAYPLQGYAADGRLILHYQPGSYVDQNLPAVGNALAHAYQYIEGEIGPSFDSPLDLYLAGSLFQDQENLRGFTQSGLFRSYLLVDGTGTLGEQTYLFAHEFTHIFAFHQWGQYHSPMVHEGLGTYLPQPILEDRTDYLPLDEICLAIKDAGRLIPMTALASQGGYGPPYYEGHIRSFLYYNQSACFVKYLIENYGFGLFTDIFNSGDYPGVYGKSLADLDSEFQASLEGNILTIDPIHFVDTVELVAAAYDDYFIRTSGGQHADFQAYLTLDGARLSVNAGDLDQADQFLDTYYRLIGE
jgi:LysM repeat protein